ncbi:MAG: tRNA lysidine(34) synthetase TilS [Gallionellaceae bacterium]|jgi:tRNA(Ile)-lysidine synthase
MANSRKSKSNLQERVAHTLRPVVSPQSSIIVGLSGGMDSVVLLHLLHALAADFAWQISALHVHHGISPNADAWADFCGSLCASYAIPLQIEKVNIAPLREEHGIEAAARHLRHAAFARQQCDFVAVAHHADDQVETLLLQLLRGAGTKGASSMSLINNGNNISTLRPLLEIPRSDLLYYAQQHDLHWVEDESNKDISYPRNFLRQKILPLLESKFPAYRETLTRSARHFAEANQLLDELAEQDINRGWSPTNPDYPLGNEAPVGAASAANGIRQQACPDFNRRAGFLMGVVANGQFGIHLTASRLRELAPHRAKNALRYFFNQHGAPMPHETQLNELIDQLCNARSDAAVCMEWGNWQVRRYRDTVYVMPKPDEFDQTMRLIWQGEAEIVWPGLNGLRPLLFFEAVKGQGISLHKLQGAAVSLRFRQGGEVLRPHANGVSRSIKNLLQEHHIPPWERERLALLYCGEELVSIVGVAIASDFQAAENEPGLLVSYSPQATTE